MERVKTEQAFREAIEQEKLCVALFKTDWCKDCHYLDVFFPEVVEKYAEKFQFIEVDRDELPDLCADLHILGIPSFIVFRQGKELVRFVSKLRKTREEVEQFLDRALEVSKALAE
ncbi:thioredoxin family protein [Ferviditalea candida]|uniref:Thioredoxin family protein n=1 Tax=Ferviditalea candida TaxID=3108399 RepID=A0ABU5ZF11_9BACL|nr:thioredoxin family protein [Paenibacillaceae bacterium T2]